MRSPKVPPEAEIVRTFAAYGQFVEAFCQGHYQLLIVVGRPGLTKSYEFEERLGRRGHLIKGWAAPLQAYIEAFRHRDRLLVFDDAEVLWKRPGGRILIRSLTEHRKRKLIQWRSTTKDLTKAGVPQSFLTNSKVAIVTNRFVFGGEEEREAVLDRGHLIHFAPTAVEVHKRLGDWFWDQEIYDHIGERLHMLDNSSARTYIKVWERKKAGGNWKQLIEEAYCHGSTKLLVQILEADHECHTVDDRIHKFVDQTGMSRATYFNIKRELREKAQLNVRPKIDVPRRVLRGVPPEDADEQECVLYPESDADTGHHPEICGSPHSDQGKDKAPPWCDYSDNPSDYGNFSDYVADWWKRPKPIESEDFDETSCGTDQFSWLRRELKKAIDREDYERAAELHDKLKQMQNEQETDND